MFSYAQYFKSPLLADAEMLILLRSTQLEDQEPPQKRAKADGDQAASTAVENAYQQLAAFPAHQLILFNSDYFKAQMQHWQNTQEAVACNSEQETSSSAAAARPTFKLTIDDADQLPAAEAVLAIMYGVEKAISNLQQQQQVHAAVIADMVHVGAAVEQAVQALQTAAEAAEGLTDTALEALASIPWWPACLQQHLLLKVVQRARCCHDMFRGADIATILAADRNNCIQRMLLAVFGNLQAVWEDKQTQELLLQLPLPAMQLLLSSDQLRVPSEDTVLYTAQQYVAAQRDARFKQVTGRELSRLVRAPHLSQFVLTCLALAHDNQLLMCEYKPQLQSLLSLKLIASETELAGELASIAAPCSWTPCSWTLGERQKHESGDVRVVWELGLEELAQACKSSFAEKRAVKVFGPESAPFAGLAWKTAVRCQPQDGGTVVGKFAVPCTRPKGVYYKPAFTIS